MDSWPPELLSPVLEGPVTVHIITPQLTKTAMIALERGLFKTVRSVSDFFGWAAANLTGPLEKDEESCGGKRVRIVSEESLATVHFFWRRSCARSQSWGGVAELCVPCVAHAHVRRDARSCARGRPLTPHGRALRLREERRRVDWLECELALTHSALSSNSSSLHYVGLHLLWNTAMRPYEHANVTDSMLKQLCKLLSSNELRVQSIAAVVVWHFAQNKQTLARLPFQVAVPALLDQLRTEEEAIKQQLVISTIRQAQVDQPGMVDDVARVFLSLKGEGDQLASSIAERASTAPSSIEQLQMLQELRATATTGRTLASLRVVATGALIALLETEQGRAAFHKIRGHNAVLGLLKQPDMASGEAAHHLFLGIVSIGSTQAQMHACRVFFEHGLETLVRIITGRKPQSSGAPVTPSGRLVAASALSYCVAHSSYHTLRLLPSTFKLVDRESSASYTYAGLLGQLRAGLVGLLLPIAMFSAQADMRGLHAAKGALSMLVSMTTCMWGLAQPLFTRQEPITGSSALLAVLLRILRLAMDGRRSEAELALYKPFAPQLRSATLAFLSCLEIDPDDLEQEYVPRAPTTESEKRNAEEELGFTAAQQAVARGRGRPLFCRRAMLHRADFAAEAIHRNAPCALQEWNTENKEEVAAKKLQARRRGALARHKTKAQLELKRQVLAEQKSVAKGLTVKAQGSEDESFSKIPGQVPPPPVLVTVSSRYLVKPRKRAIGQGESSSPDKLESGAGDQSSDANHRSTEITCAALSALANSVKLDLIEQSGIPRLITLIAHLHSLRKGTIISPKQAEREARKAHRISLWGGISEDLPKEEVAPQQQTYFLNGSCAMTHAYLCYSLLVLVKAVSTRGGLVGDEKATLNRSALQVLLEALDASAGGALHATATMWRLANAGYAEHLCSTGAIPALKVNPPA
ncbi:hypothetical protein AB1Y20_019890 [Prymnesium parvum]|uniref:HEAT repeat-containing protein 1 n=1 Tax=Prymnesium parvum TaxID=97485 RepID=A0AB34JT45_PRYPA